MFRVIALTGVAAAVLSLTVSTLATADLAPPIQFDLGIDIGSVAPTPEAVRQFLSTLSPESSDSIIRQCQSFLAKPGSATAMETLIFCSIAANPPA
jgi:hypothetical protein